MKHDKTKDGWVLLETVPFTEIKNIELVPFLEGTETCVTGDVMAERAKKLNANMGQEHAEYLLEHQELIPKEARDYFLVFPGTIWRLPGGGRNVAYLRWNGEGWYLDWGWLDYGWYGSNRLVRPRELDSGTSVASGFIYGPWHFCPNCGEKLQHTCSR